MQSQHNFLSLTRKSIKLATWALSQNYSCPFCIHPFWIPLCRWYFLYIIGNLLGNAVPQCLLDYSVHRYAYRCRWIYCNERIRMAHVADGWRPCSVWRNRQAVERLDEREGSSFSLLPERWEPCDLYCNILPAVVLCNCWASWKYACPSDQLQFSDIQPNRNVVMEHQNRAVQNRADFGKDLHFWVLLPIGDNQLGFLSRRIFLPMSYESLAVPGGILLPSGLNEPYTLPSWKIYASQHRRCLCLHLVSCWIVLGSNFI